MFFSISLYLALAICVLGVLFRLSRWFRQGVTAADRRIGVGPRISGVLRVTGGALCGRGILVLAKTVFLDILLLRRSFRQNLFRWTMHMLIFWGFMLLLLMHALEKQISAVLLPDYMSTLNPYLFLREVFAVMVLVGIGMALYRRFLKPGPRLKTNAMDVLTVVLLAAMLGSGFFLKGAKIASRSEFIRMVENYSFITEDAEIQDLESLWVADYGLVSPIAKGPFDAETLAAGRELNEMSCVGCHSKSKWAFVSYAAARLTRPITGISEGAALVSVLWHIHILACLAGLAWLPFGKLFHVLASFLSLLCASPAEAKSDPGAAAVRRVMALDACTHCGACSERCSVGITTEAITNALILPSEKLQALRARAAGGQLAMAQSSALVEGLVVCTSCNRCTDVCPVGIDLQDIWTVARADLLQSGLVEPYVLSHLQLHSILSARDGTTMAAAEAPGAVVHERLLERFGKTMDDDVLAHRGQHPEDEVFQRRGDFQVCFSCRTCTSSCPVLDHFEEPAKELGLLPHQIIHATVLGFSDLVAASRMLWACLGCYQCQEQCPQGVRVTDVLYAHKQAALSRLKTGDLR